jgi:hypothetical protein
MTKKQSEEKQFLKFAILICVSGVVFSTLSGVLWTNFSSTGNKNNASPSSALITTVQENPVTFSAVSGATSDLEISPKPWWIYSRESLFELLNPSARNQIVKLKLTLGRNPCGFEVTGKLSFGNSLEELSLEKPLLLMIEMKPNSKLNLPISVNSYACAIDSDPRIFLASLNSALSYHSSDEYVFDR